MKKMYVIGLFALLSSFMTVFILSKKNYWKSIVTKYAEDGFLNYEGYYNQKGIEVQLPAPVERYNKKTQKNEMTQTLTAGEFNRNFRYLLETFFFDKGISTEVYECVEKRGADSTIQTWNAEKLKAVMQKYYLKPRESIMKTSNQQLYDVVLKAYLRAMSEEIANTVAQKPLLLQLAKEYEEAQKKEDFNGIDFCWNATEKFWAKNSLKKDSDEYNMRMDRYASGYRIVGMVLRRQIDGSLPAIVSTLRQILQDYDKAQFNKVGKDLVW